MKNYSVHRTIGLTKLATLDVTETGPRAFYINRILVPQSHRCQGLGTAMMCELLTNLPPNAVVEVHPTRNYNADLERLTAFFTRLGFTRQPGGALQWSN